MDTRLCITPLEFGAVGDGVADDTRALQSAVDTAVANKIKLTSPMAAVYAVTAPIEVRGVLNADFELCAVYTDGSDSFVRWKVAPEDRK